MTRPYILLGVAMMPSTEMPGTRESGGSGFVLVALLPWTFSAVFPSRNATR